MPIWRKLRGPRTRSATRIKMWQPPACLKRPSTRPSAANGSCSRCCKARVTPNRDFASQNNGITEGGSFLSCCPFYLYLPSNRARTITCDVEKKHETKKHHERLTLPQ